MIKQMKIRVKTLAPVIISSSNDSTVMTESESYIRGSILRGVLAQAFIRKKHLEEGAEKDRDFAFLFLGGIRFIHAYLMEDGKRAMPVPKSLQKAKTGKQVLDLLQQAPEAGYKKITGFGVIDKGTELVRVDAEKEINFHMSRGLPGERLSGSSMEGGVFNYESISAGQVFEGLLIGDEQALALLAGVLGRNEISCRLGKSHFTEYGLCSIRLENMESLPEVEIPGHTLYCRLDTPLLSYGLPENGRELLEEVLDTIRAETGKKDLALGSIYAAAFDTARFISVWGMKSPALYGLDAGSVFAVKAESPWTREEAEALENLLYDGVGADREDGFGQIRLWNEKISALGSGKEKRAEKPVSLNTEVRRRAHHILMRRILEKVKIQAYDDVRSVQKLDGMTHVFSRLENMLGYRDHLDDAPERFQRKFEDNLRVHSRMDKHLEDIKLHGRSLSEYLKEGVTPENPDDFTKGILENLPGELGFILTGEDKGAIFYEYWLWFFRHGRKLSVKAAKEED